MARTPLVRFTFLWPPAGRSATPRTGAAPLEASDPARTHRRARVRPSATLVPLLFVALLGLGVTALPAQAAAAPAVGVRGNTLVDGNGRPLRLLGVNRAGTEYACIQGWGIFDGPVDDAALALIADWGANAVRVPLNEDCWLGQNVAAAYGGETYRSAIQAYVRRLHAAGLVAVIDLHWSAPGSARAASQAWMADAVDAPAFWRSVATRFRDDPSVVFDLYNEPHDVSWACWRDGCTTAQGWEAAGMQDLVDAVRSTGATQPVMATGLEWGNDLTQWLAHRPYDPRAALVAGVHLYSFNRCIDAGCWDATFGAVARQVPVVTGELGENDCSAQFVNRYMDWADANGVSYLGWAWNPYDCGGFPSLIRSYDGTPTPMGEGVRARLRRHAAATPPPAPAPSPTPSATPTPSPTPSPAPTASPPGTLRLEYRSGDTLAFDDSARARFRLTNTGSAALPLSELTVRYWFSDTRPGSHQAWCDYSNVGCANVTVRIGRPPTPRVGADHYMDVGFLPSAGSLAPGATLQEVQVRFHRADWQTLDESNDRSFAARTVYGTTSRVTVYRAGRVIAGTVPSGTIENRVGIRDVVPPDIGPLDVTRVGGLRPRSTPWATHTRATPAGAGPAATWLTPQP